jgi:plasmid stability protein
MYNGVMAMIQVRDLPDEVHRALRIKAAEAGLSLSAYLRRELAVLAERKSVAEVLAEWKGERAEIAPAAVIEAVHEGRR